MPEETNRRIWLIKEAARAFDQYIDPFAGDWLKKHEVDTAERWVLCDSITAILMGYVASSRETQQAIMRAYAGRGLMEEMG